MATSVKITREIADHEPNGGSVVRIEPDNDAGFNIIQDSDRIWLTLEHARAVHAALGAAIADAEAMV